ncbi:MAG: hypothetical protein J6I50_10660 [Clostridia bacterium]|nr:hypothetical protein [Clostridia bacterium]
MCNDKHTWDQATSANGNGGTGFDSLVSADTVSGSICAEKAAFPSLNLPFWSLPRMLWLTKRTGYPDSVENGKRIPEEMRFYRIHSDFRTGIRLRCLWEEPYYLTRAKQLLATTRRLLFAEPEMTLCCSDDAVMEAVVWYLLDGRMSRRKVREMLFSPRKSTAKRGDASSCDENQEQRKAQKEKGCFSYKWDMPDLYASFLQVYHVDLCSKAADSLHLWQFDAMLRGLPDTCGFSRLTALRSISLSDIPDDDVRAETAALQCRLRIPQETELNEMCIDTQICAAK